MTRRELGRNIGEVHNESRQKLLLLGVNPVSHPVCRGVFVVTCDEEFFDIDFEGRPSDGALVDPGGVQTWGLKYAFSFSHLFGQTNYAARLSYRIEPANSLFEVAIRTSNYTNDSTCDVIENSSFRCQAEGLDVTFR
jgi:hypothetical protein